MNGGSINFYVFRVGTIIRYFIRLKFLSIYRPMGFNGDKYRK